MCSNDDGVFKVVICVDSNFELFVEQSILTFAFFQAKMPLNLYFQAKMPLNLAFADPNYLDVATKKRVADEVNLEVYISYFCICPPNWKCYELRLRMAFTNPGDVAPF